MRILENKAVSKIFEGRVKSDWRNLNNEESYNFYFLPNNIRVITSRRMRWAYSTHSNNDKITQNSSKNLKG